ncbi:MULTISPECIES: TetR/AcrR family transcriptional regulator [Acinetobacter]|jgi:AcrR family transcriptional regulator|uniref:TetR family transcriptional regulator n=1 Tax=Acinetobacter pittii TaxID=48296 RepID=A0A242U5P5_ACIPI|nr:MULTISPECIES: TetR/AcrR family transcriptional regulator [Acinetobacter]EXS25501.1 bacterial regulatory s, tetR family protein [Acinetobacter baumannii 573719]MBJ8470293.1 TetR/AcrR family transcriptional regulator [Acinetobacter pittii]MBJ8500374.1 TetR/AcrR family transcriptional regulator [Acinetobacter pittii]MBJ9891116.1 TetR/AcrR family transcriptional regulator [Acinetobacter pittii]MCU4477658.1 TetR/AcrR family transcriptional regulator [Acinetobacter sp. WU_MDCI_Abxd143]
MQSAQELLERLYPGRRAALKRQILLDALSCFLENGIETTSIEMIRLKSDSSVGAIYHHFKNKEGIVATLFFAALDDQAALRDDYLEGAKSLQDVLYAFIHSYIDWVSEQPEFAKFLISARFSVMQGEDQERLVQKNKLRNQKIFSEISKYAEAGFLKAIPHELLLSLVIGSTENYCRAWLSQRVTSNPKVYKYILAKAAWDSLQNLS